MTDFQQILEECLTSLSNGASTVEECLTRYPEHAARLRPLLRTVLFMNLGRDVKPSPAFKARTRSSLTRYLQSHPRRPRNMPSFWRIASTLTVFIAAFLVTGTAHAQAALPGDAFYNWKRTSEQVWSALSPDPVATDIALANRRLNEWIAVSNDPARNTSAMDDYFEVLTKLESVTDTGTQARILPVLKSHHNMLKDAGLSASELDHYLVVGTVSAPVDAIPQVPATDHPEIQPTIPSKPEPSDSSNTEPVIVPSEVAPTAVSTEVVATAVPTEVVATAVPTEAVATAVPTEAAPTDVPSEVVPTDVPSEAAPTDVPSEAAPTDIPQTQPTNETP